MRLERPEAKSVADYPLLRIWHIGQTAWSNTWVGVGFSWRIRYQFAPGDSAKWESQIEDVYRWLDGGYR
jgi:hypothetical protein